MTNRIANSKLWFLALVLINCAAAPQPDLAKLKQDADAILTVDRPVGRPQVAVVFEAAEAFASAGQLSAAEYYYAGGLGIEPHDFAHHLAYAELLGKEHKQAAEKVQAQIVVKGCEDAALVAKAQSLLGIPPAEVTPFDQTKLPTGPTIVLVPLGDVDIFLLQQEQTKLHDDLGIEVQIHSLPVKMHGSARSTLHPQAEAMRAQLDQIREKNSEAYSKLLEAAGMSDEDLKDDMNVVRLFSHALRSSGRGDQADQIDHLANRRGEQWAAEDMLADLKAAVPPQTSDRIRLIGVTSHDIFSKPTNFLFGWTEGPCSIVSYRRFMASFGDEIPNRERLLRRFHFQCLSSAGRVFGIPPCNDPTCPRSYPHDLAEEDAKSDKLCDNCRQAFDAAFKSH
jgi:predicted Zn-dependent protease